MQGLGLLLLLLALFWFWYTSLRAREIALQLVLKSLDEYGLQLLDGSIYMKKIWPTRLPSGAVGLLRFYLFDYSAYGAERYRGLIVLVANQLEYLQLEKDGHAIVISPGVENDPD